MKKNESKPVIQGYDHTFTSLTSVTLTGYGFGISFSTILSTYGKQRK